MEEQIVQKKSSNLIIFVVIALILGSIGGWCYGQSRGYQEGFTLGKEEGLVEGKEIGKEELLAEQEQTVQEVIDQLEAAANPFNEEEDLNPFSEGEYVNPFAE